MSVLHLFSQHDLQYGFQLRLIFIILGIISLFFVFSRGFKRVFSLSLSPSLLGGWVSHEFRERGRFQAAIAYSANLPLPPGQKRD